MTIPVQTDKVLLHDIRRLIEETRSTVAVTVNSALTMLYWQVGKRINEEVLKGRAGRIRGTNCLYTVTTIDVGLWRGFLGKKYSPYD